MCSPNPSIRFVPLMTRDFNCPLESVISGAQPEMSGIVDRPASVAGCVKVSIPSAGFADVW